MITVMPSAGLMAAEPVFTNRAGMRVPVSGCAIFAWCAATLSVGAPQE